jgi:hypothetical protein
MVQAFIVCVYRVYIELAETLELLDYIAVIHVALLVFGNIHVKSIILIQSTRNPQTGKSRNSFEFAAFSMCDEDGSGGPA